MSGEMKVFSVKPNIPSELSKLKDIAMNLWWCWNPEGVELFKRIDRQLWDKVDHNPVKLLSKVSQERLEELKNNESFIDHLQMVSKDLDDYMTSDAWFQNNIEKGGKKVRYAYFSAEFGIHESLAIYSGGLGILAGDHLKSASDLGLPLVAVGLLYSGGYFSQKLNGEGWQQEDYPQNDFNNMGISPAKNEAGEEVEISVDIKGTEVFAKVWQAKVGRITLYLLDTNIAKNPVEYRDITAQLYGGGIIMRIKQEILLGIGGVRALKALGFEPDVYHMNEGHSAFLSVENIRDYMAKNNFSFYDAKEAVVAESVFTTHTPVPAGNDRFEPKLIEEYFKDYIKDLGITMDEFLSLGRENPYDKKEEFCMTVLALKLSGGANGVSALHGEVSRDMWTGVWKGVPVNEIPIEHITNGVHVPSWVSDDMSILFDRYLGRRWREEAYDAELWERVENIPNTELWRTHERLRARLVSFIRERQVAQLVRNNASDFDIEEAKGVFSSDVLTIGFARRFATYKRGTLLFKDIDRLKRIVHNSERPVQFVFAGKAHPADNGGKEFIKAVVQASRDPELKNHIIFLEDYRIDVARYLVQGVDIWLNNPIRPLEASGTSGMKVCPNGGLNFSILDGWWCEGSNGHNGFDIGNGEYYNDEHTRDEIESRLIYETLEKEIIPAFYDRADDSMPLKWLKLMKNSMKTLTGMYHTNRQVRDYTEMYYVKAEKNGKAVKENGFAKAIELNKNKYVLYRDWENISFGEVKIDKDETFVGDCIKITVPVTLGGEITPELVDVQAYYSTMDNNDNMEDPKIASLEFESEKGGIYTFEGKIPVSISGRYGLKIRVVPSKEKMVEKFAPGLISWN